MSAYELVYIDDPGPPPQVPFRCSACMEMQYERGEWIHRWKNTPGHFMAVCADGFGCRAPRRKWWPFG